MDPETEKKAEDYLIRLRIALEDWILEGEKYKDSIYVPLVLERLKDVLQEIPVCRPPRYGENREKTR